MFWGGGLLLYMELSFVVVEEIFNFWLGGRVVKVWVIVVVVVVCVGIYINIMGKIGIKESVRERE